MTSQAIDVHEELADAVMARFGQRDSCLAHFFGEEAMRDLHEDAAAVTELRVCPDRTAMVEVEQDLQALADDAMGLPALDIGHEADAARVVLVAWVVKSLFLGQIHQKNACCQG